MSLHRFFAGLLASALLWPASAFADFTAEVHTVTTSTTAVAQEVNLDGAFTPKVDLFIGGLVTTLGNSTPDNVAVGAATSSSARWAGSVREGDANATENSDRNFSSTKVFTVNSGSGGAPSQEADFTTQDSDGYTITWGIANATGRNLSSLSLGGSDLTAAVGTFNSDTDTGPQTVSTGLSCTVTAVIFWNSLSNTTDTSTAIDDGQGTFGFATATEEATVTVFGDDAADPMDNARYLSTTDAFARISASAVVDAFDVTGFGASDGTIALDWTTNNATSKKIGYVALCGVQSDIVTITQPTSNGSASVSGLAFAPKAVLTISASSATTGSVVAGSTMMIGAATDSTHQMVLIGASNDNVATSESDKRHLSTGFISSLTAGTPTVNASADFTSMDATGFTYNWSATDATQRITIGLVLGPTAAVAQPRTVESGLVISGAVAN